MPKELHKLLCVKHSDDTTNPLDQIDIVDMLLSFHNARG